MTPPRTAAEALRAAMAQLPSLDARALLAHALGIAPDRLTLHLPDPISDAAMTAMEFAEPVAQRFVPSSGSTAMSTSG